MMMAGSHRPGGTGRAAPLTVALRLFMAPVQCVAATHWQAACRAGGIIRVNARPGRTSCRITGPVPAHRLPGPAVSSLRRVSATGGAASATGHRGRQWHSGARRAVAGPVPSHGEPRRDSERPPPTRGSSWHFRVHRPGPGHHMRPTAHGCHGLHLKFAAAWAAAGPGADPPPPESRVRD